MKKAHFFILILFFQIRVLAAVTVGLSQLYQIERGNLVNDKVGTGQQLGVYYQSVIFEQKMNIGAEYYRTVEQPSGNSTYSIVSQSHGLFMSGKILPTKGKIQPFLSAGLGVIQKINSQTLYTQVEHDFSKLYFSSYAGGGLQFQILNELSIATEGKIHFSEASAQQPYWAILVNMNIHL